MTIPAVIFPVGADTYAVAADMVREVVSAPRPTRVPTVASELVGAINLRGEVVPMFDLAALLGIGSVVEAPFASVPRLHVTVPEEWVQVQFVPVALTNVTPLGSVSTTLTADASSGPALLTPIV